MRDVLVRKVTFFTALKARDGTEVDTTAAAATATTTCSAVRAAVRGRHKTRQIVRMLVKTQHYQDRKSSSPEQVPAEPDLEGRRTSGRDDALVCEMTDLLAVEGGIRGVFGGNSVEIRAEEGRRGKEKRKRQGKRQSLTGNITRRAALRQY